MRALRFLASLLVLVFAGAATASPGEVERYALIVGNNQPGSRGAVRLRYADDDALATQQLMIEAGVKARVLTRLDDDTRSLNPAARVHGLPRYDELSKTLQTLAVEMKSRAARGVRTEFFFFYGGHGDVDHGEGYVILEDRRLTRAMLFELLKLSSATHNHVFVDACKSYYLVFNRGPGGRRTPYASFPANTAPAALENTGFVLSTSSNRDSHEWERYQGGVLSHEIRSALRGAADVDLSGSITYAELGAFLATANQSIKNPRFRPDFMVRAPGRDLERPVLTWSPRPAALEFVPKSWGHFYVETARGERVLDAHPAPGQALRLWAPAERPLFVRRQDERGETVVLRERSQITSLSTSPEVARRGALSLAFEWLFEAPFGQDSVQRFKRGVLESEREEAARYARTRRGDPVVWVTGGIAVAATAAGLTLNGVALGNSLVQGGTQLDVTARNERIQDLNRTSIALYGAAAVAGFTWAWATWLRSPSLTFTPVPAPGGSNLGSGFTLDIRRRF